MNSTSTTSNIDILAAAAVLSEDKTWGLGSLLEVDRIGPCLIGKIHCDDRRGCAEQGGRQNKVEFVMSSFF